MGIPALIPDDAHRLSNEELYTKLVPGSGKADTVAGELLRALRQLTDRYYNYGEMVGVRHGNATCNPAARFLMRNTNWQIYELLEGMWGNEYMYEDSLGKLENRVFSYVRSHDYLMYAKNKEDMFHSTTEFERSWQDKKDDLNE